MLRIDGRQVMEKRLFLLAARQGRKVTPFRLLSLPALCPRVTERRGADATKRQGEKSSHGKPDVEVAQDISPKLALQVVRENIVWNMVCMTVLSSVCLSNDDQRLDFSLQAKLNHSD